MMLILPLFVTGGPTVNAAGIVTPTLVTVPTDHALFIDRFCVIPFIVIVLVLGTGVYPSTLCISNAVTGVADVTRPFAFAPNFKNVLDPYTLLFTVPNVNVVGLPVIPFPVTSPTNVSMAEGTVMVIGVTFVTNPLLLTVILGTCVVDPYTPGLLFTVANVTVAAPGPEADASPIKLVI